MKKTIIIGLAFLLNACGYQQAFRDNCRIGNTQMCDTLFGVNQAEVDQTQDARLKQNEKEIESLTTMLNELVKDVRAVEANTIQTQNQLTLLNLISQQQNIDINLVNQLITELNTNLTSLQEKIAYEQTRILGIEQDLAQLSTQDGINQAIYPCGDRPNVFDEALLQMKSGKLIAYFESNGNRMLTILGPGSYRTTDYAPYCYFDITSAGEIKNAKRQ